MRGGERFGGRGLAAAGALAATLVARPTPAERRVAVVNAARDPGAAAVAAGLRQALAADPELEPIPPGDLSRALEGPATADVAAREQLAAIDGELLTARGALDRLQSARCLAAARRADERLLEVPPGAAASERLAALAFLSGLCQLREQNRGLAEASFALAAGLDPALAAPDPARYPPEVVEAVARARRPIAATVPLSVSATFDGAEVEVDGVTVGRTPWRGRVAPGRRRVRVWAAAFRPASRIVELEDAAALRLDLVLLPAADRARALRAVLADPAAARAGDRAAALLAVADLAEVDGALLVSDAPGGGAAAGVQIALYLREPRRLSNPRPADRADGLFGLLVATGPPAAVDLVLRPRDEPRWYARPWGVLALAAGGVAAATAAALALGAGDAEPGPRTGQVEGFGP